MLKQLETIQDRTVCILIVHDSMHWLVGVGVCVQFVCRQQKQWGLVTLVHERILSLRSYFADVFSLSIILFSSALQNAIIQTFSFLNNTWVKTKIGSVCGELQNRSVGLTCSNPVGASLYGPRTSRGLWPGLDVAVNGEGGEKICGVFCPPNLFSLLLSQLLIPGDDLFPAFRWIVEYLASWSVPL